MDHLHDMHCSPIPAGTPPLDIEATRALLAEVDAWHVNEEGTAILREFRFRDYFETIAFVNALAWIVHHEDHHPELRVHYNRCQVIFSTHSVGGLSKNDFICAARTDTLLDAGTNQKPA